MPLEAESVLKFPEREKLLQEVRLSGGQAWCVSSVDDIPVETDSTPPAASTTPNGAGPTDEEEASAATATGAEAEAEAEAEATHQLVAESPVRAMEAHVGNEVEKIDAAEEAVATEMGRATPVKLQAAEPRGIGLPASPAPWSSARLQRKPSYAELTASIAEDESAAPPESVVWDLLLREAHASSLEARPRLARDMYTAAYVLSGRAECRALAAGMMLVAGAPAEALQEYELLLAMPEGALSVRTTAVVHRKRGEAAAALQTPRQEPLGGEGDGGEQASPRNKHVLELLCQQVAPCPPHTCDRGTP